MSENTTVTGEIIANEVGDEQRPDTGVRLGHDNEVIGLSDEVEASMDIDDNRFLTRHELLVAEGDAAGDYLERLLDILDFDGDIDLDVEGERAVVSIIGEGDIGKLAGERGEVLEALQELARLAATVQTGQRSRLMLDVGGYRARRRVELTDLGVTTAEQVLSSGEPFSFPAMNPFERKIVHDAVGTVDGVGSSSDGVEPRRHVVVSLVG